jgi:hypothetical protein
MLIAAAASSESAFIIVDGRHHFVDCHRSPSTPVILVDCRRLQRFVFYHVDDLWTVNASYGPDGTCTSLRRPMNPRYDDAQAPAASLRACMWALWRRHSTPAWSL